MNFRVYLPPTRSGFKPYSWCRLVFFRLELEWNCMEKLVISQLYNKGGVPLGIIANKINYSNYFIV